MALNCGPTRLGSISLAMCFLHGRTEIILTKENVSLESSGGVYGKGMEPHADSHWLSLGLSLPYVLWAQQASRMKPRAHSLKGPPASIH